MSNQFDSDNEEELRRRCWEQRMAEMKRQKEKREWLNRNLKKYAGYGGALLGAVCVIGVGIAVYGTNSDAEAEEKAVVQEASLAYIPEETVAKTPFVADAVQESQAIPEVQDTATEESDLGQDVELQNVEAAETTVPDENVTEQEGVGETLPEQIPAEFIVQEAAVQHEQVQPKDDATQAADILFWDGYVAESTNATRTVGEEDVISDYAVLIDASNGTIIAQRDAKTIINPASMTKVLTVLVAAEHVTNLDDTFTMTLDITDYAYVNDCSSVGFLNEETVTVRDLFYGTILPSGGDAAVALATYVAGSQEAFVDMMNDKLEELGLSETAHFTNCVGLYDKEHYCTVYDMAIIMKAAAENDLCREVMSARKYTTSATEQHPEGISISNWFLRRIEDKDTGGEVLCGKTGFVNQSGSCAASCGISDSGVPYICVTAKSTSSWKCIYDHVALYSEFAK